MSKNIDILKARSYYYEFLAEPFFFSEDDTRFKNWYKKLAQISTQPLNEESVVAFENLAKFNFTEFAKEQNSVLFDMSYINVPLNVSFYEEGRDDGAARLRVIEILKKSEYRRNFYRCKDSEDFIGFVFLLMATFLRDEANGNDTELSRELFSSVINGFVDEFASMLEKHKQANLFKSISIILQSFILLERSLLGLESPIRAESTQSVAEEALHRQPYQTKMPTPKSKLHWEEFATI
ncbi:formate dehydrogenase-specific chaperone [Campylobacter sp. faydin G-140]|uniref:TorD/DmsD family molecular chaperone n=1 Tax=Campylobacter anatolicus TaxID=2829105 RepID=UPI001BA2CD61|nr:formate dehydrogenase-specific chaperone [Campylobacter anatolicus]MBR8465295.1 formate dehydrogenase-specific chaperone [Campylobacter anatolicus]